MPLFRKSIHIPSFPWIHGRINDLEVCRNQDSYRLVLQKSSTECNTHRSFISHRRADNSKRYLYLVHLNFLANQGGHFLLVIISIDNHLSDFPEVVAIERNCMCVTDQIYLIRIKPVFGLFAYLGLFFVKPLYQLFQ